MFIQIQQKFEYVYLMSPIYQAFLNLKYIRFIPNKDGVLMHLKYAFE